MGQEQKPGPLLRKPDSGGPLNLQQEPPDSGLNMLIDGVEGLLGFDSGKDYTGRGMPGSPVNMGGQLTSAMMPMLPIKKLLQLMKMGKIPSEIIDGGLALDKTVPNPADKALREHLYDALPEFAPADHGNHPPLSLEEQIKEAQLTGHSIASALPLAPEKPTPAPLVLPPLPKRRTILNDETGAIGELGALSPYEQKLQDRFHQAVDSGVQARGRAQRQSATQAVDSSYQDLADRGLAAWPSELDKLKSQVQSMKSSKALLKPAPQGTNVGANVDMANKILDKIAAGGYKPAPTDLSRLVDMIKNVSIEKGDDLPIGQMAMILKGNLHANRPNKGLADPLAKAIGAVTGWGSK